MCIQVHSQQSHQIRKGPVKFGSELKETENQYRHQSCPNLDPDGIGTGAHKGLDLKVMLQGFKGMMKRRYIRIEVLNHD